MATSGTKWTAFDGTEFETQEAAEAHETAKLDAMKTFITNDLELAGLSDDALTALATKIIQKIRRLDGVARQRPEL